MPYHHQWLYLRDEVGAYEIFNGARTASYLANSDLQLPGSVRVYDVAEHGGCEGYGFHPPCDEDLESNHVVWPAAATASNYLSIPDAANISAPTQLDIRVALRDAIAQSTVRSLVGHRTSSATEFTFAFQVSVDDRLQLLTSITGSTGALQNALADAASPLTTNELQIVRVTWRSSDGRVQFFNKLTTDDSIDADLASNTGWTQMGANKVAATAALFNSSGPLLLGQAIPSSTLSQPLVGRVYAASLATTIDAAPVVSMTNASLPLSADAPSFVIPTGQTVTAVRAASGPQLYFEYDEMGGWNLISVEDPSFDPAPWFSATHSESADFLGFWIEEWTGLDDGHVRRALTPTGRPGGGAQLGSLTNNERVMKLNVLAIARSEEAMEFGYRWLATVLSSVCASCATSSALIRRFCPQEGQDLWDGVVELREVGLVEGVAWEGEISPYFRCYVRRLSFALAAGDPCMYLPPYSVAGVTTGTASTCYTALPLAPGKATCRPTCQSLPSSCRTVFTFDVDAYGAAAPVLTLVNDNDAPVPPLRVICYADPDEVGASPNPCGLQILGEIYTGVIPPWTTLKWDVTGRNVQYADHTTPGLVPGFRLIDANDVPHRRFFALPCGTSHIVIEPANVCLEVDTPNSRYSYGGYYFLWSEMHFPTATLEIQERIGCA